MPSGARVPHRFEATLTLLGSGSFEILPVGIESRITLSSSWPDPSFLGAYLPEEHQVGADGFQARWTVLDLAQSRPRRWWDGQLADPDPQTHRARSLDSGRLTIEGPVSVLGVALYQPIDHYQRCERSLKYALLFILLTFVTIFLHEVTGRVALHPMHYLLVGAALVLFYLLLLSLTEIIAFGYAYLVAATVVVVQITLYSTAVMRHRGRALTLGAVTALLYGAFWVVLTAADEALLLGTVGLFVALGLVMYLTRRLDWSMPTGRTTEPTPEGPLPADPRPAGDTEC